MKNIKLFHIIFLLFFLSCCGVVAKKISDNLDVAGNITLTGTVDGRDISVDLDQNVKVADTPSFTGINLTAPILMSHESTPSNPAASNSKLYFKNDDNLYKLNSAGSEVEVGVATGADTDLGNLTATSIDFALNPTLDNAIDLGTGFNSWRLIYGRLFLGTDGITEFGTDFNSGLEARFNSGSSNTAANTNIVIVQTGDQLGSGTGTVGPLNLETGEIFEVTNANDTGNINIKPGLTAGAGSRGSINLIDGSEGINNECWVSVGTSGAGNWDTCPGGGGADTTLSNLTGATAINQIFTPDGDLTRIIGTNSKRWSSIIGGTLRATDKFRIENNSFGVRGDIRADETTPDGVSVDIGIFNNQSAGNLGIWTVEDSNSDGIQVGDVRLETGTKTHVSATGKSGDLYIITGDTAGSGDSGAVIIETGTSGSGDRGNIVLNGKLINASSADEGLVIPLLSADPSAPIDGTIWYRTDTDKLKLRANGITVDLN